MDPVRELNVLTTSICPADKRKNPDEVELSAGVGLLFDEVFEQAVPTMAGDFDSLDYGLVDLAYADTVEVVEAYLMEDEIHQPVGCYRPGDQGTGKKSRYMKCSLGIPFPRSR